MGKKMEAIFKITPTGKLACSYKNVRLHSFYDPEKESERFAETAECDFNPSCILVTEPALSYCLPYLKKKFPKARFFCIRFCNDFKKYDSSWDKVFHALNVHDDELNENLSEEIFKSLGEDGIASCLFLSWKASDLAFTDISKFAWNEIKKCVLKSRSILATRNFFAGRWAKNALRFSFFAGNTATLKKGTSDIVICASGPSLCSSIKKIKETRERFFLIALSSAMLPLVSNGIIPDLCISTDGGYYAKRHISFSLEMQDIPIALPAEGSCYASIMEKNTIIPLFYGDGISESILRETGFSGMNAKRNGSVSGTAALLALNLTSGNVYFCGLDLEFSKCHAHTQPNQLEKDDAMFDTRLRPAETRISSATMNKNSIEIYRSWFSSTDFNGRVYRLSNNYPYENKLGKIQDLDFKKFKIQTDGFKNKIKPQFSILQQRKKDMELKNRLKEICAKNSNNDEWIQNAVPSEAIVMERSKETSHYDEAKKIVENGMQKFLMDITRAIEK